MRQKILSVDDSKTVRLMIKKVFKPFDCEIFEASNGVEGLSAAAKIRPDVILLDVTMPVMDGVEMLTRLKGDPKLKGIPVIMLTAEGGRDNVLNIAKLGVRGYIVKPFKEATMLEKLGQIIELKPASDNPDKQRSIVDPLDILVVEDKPAIVQQIELRLQHTPWVIRGTATARSALEACASMRPDVIIISLSLPDKDAFKLFRALRTDVKTKLTPIFALAVKTDVGGLTQAQELGFTAVVTKPIDFVELESKIAKAMNLDISAHYFRCDAEILLVSLPNVCTPAVLGDVSYFLGRKLSDAVDAGISRVVVDFHAVRALEMGIIKLMLEATQICRTLAMQIAFVGNQQLIAESKAFEETRGWQFHESLDAAKIQVGALQAPAPAPAPSQAPEPAAVTESVA